MERLTTMCESIKDILMGRMAGNPRFKEHLIFSHWSRSVGPAIDQKTCPYRFTGSTLFVHTINSTWNAHLTSIKDQLLGALRREKGPAAIHDLRFSVAYPLKGKRAREEDEDLVKELQSITLTDEEEKRLKTLASSLNDGEQEKVIYRILIKEEKWKKMLRRKGYKECTGCGVLVAGGDICPFCRNDPKEGSGIQAEADAPVPLAVPHHCPGDGQSTCLQSVDQ